MKKKKFKAPARIYLLSPLRNEDVMWCEDRIGDVDIEYVRADILKREKRRLERIIQMYREMDSGHSPSPLHGYLSSSLNAEARASVNLDRDQTQCEQERS